MKLKVQASVLPGWGEVGLEEGVGRASLCHRVWFEEGEVPTLLTDREESGVESQVQGLCPVCQARAGHGESLLVPEGVDVIVEADRGTGGAVATAAACFAAAALDPHNVSVEALPIRATKEKPHGAGQ